MVTVLSWDVGIINLAYCLIHKDGENFEIKKWGIISLSDNTKFCQFITNKNIFTITNRYYFFIYFSSLYGF